MLWPCSYAILSCGMVSELHAGGQAIASSCYMDKEVVRC